MSELPDAGWAARLGFRQLNDDANELERRFHELGLRQLPGPGWTSLIDELHHQLIGLDPDYTLQQVKEKFGRLCFYARFSPEVDERCQRLVQEAERRSSSICERCGHAGQVRDDRRWVLTLCDRCDAAEPAGRALPNEWDEGA